MPSKTLFAVFVLLANPAFSQPLSCLRCPVQMKPLGDGSDLDKAIAICNKHAIFDIHPHYETGFESCDAVLDQYHQTEAAAHERAAVAKAREDADFINKLTGPK